MAKERPAGMHLVPHALEWLVSMATKTVVSGRATSSLGHGLYSLPPPFWFRSGWNPHPHSQFSFRQGFASFRKQGLFFSSLFYFVRRLYSTEHYYATVLLFVYFSGSFFICKHIIQPELLSDVNEYKGWGSIHQPKSSIYILLAMSFWCRKTSFVYGEMLYSCYTMIWKESWCFCHYKWLRECLLELILKVNISLHEKMLQIVPFIFFFSSEMLKWI